MGQRFPWLAAYFAEHGNQMRTLFKEFLADAPLSQTELAKALGVEQPTVSRWAAGKNTPDLKQMQAVVALVKSRLAELQEKAQLTQEVLDAAEDVVAVLNGRGVGFRRLGAARERLTKLLPPRSARRQPRTRRGRSPKAR